MFWVAALSCCRSRAENQPAKRFRLSEALMRACAMIVPSAALSLMIL